MLDDKRATAELGRKARESRQDIDQEELKVVVAAAREANALIDGRTFSWTALFNQIESTLPPEVMLASVRPTIALGETKITIIALGRRTADLDEFIEKLEATGAFENLLPRQRNLNEDGLTQVTIESLYVPEAPPAGPTSPPAAPVTSSASAGGAR
jgi:hypothetical protein